MIKSDVKRLKISLDKRSFKYLDMDAKRYKVTSEVRISQIIAYYLRSEYPQMLEDDDFIIKSMDHIEKMLGG